MDDTTRRDFIQQTAALTGGVAAGSIPSLTAALGQVSPSGDPSHAMSKTSRLRTLLQQPGIGIVPEAHSVFAARLAEINDFKAIYIGGNMMAAMYLGIEDWGLINVTELVEIGGRIASGVSIPAIVDADQGGENALNVYRGVKAYEQAGIAALHIEDTRNPKHRGRGRSELMPLDEMALRISAAVEARSDPNFVIICRSDCLSLGQTPGDTTEAIRRGAAFAEAGGDAFFCVGMRRDQVDQIARAVPIPLVALNIPLDDVRNTALKLDIHAVQVYQPVMKLYEEMLAELKEHGQFLRREERRLMPETMARVLRRAEYEHLAEEWMKLRG